MAVTVVDVGGSEWEVHDDGLVYTSCGTREEAEKEAAGVRQELAVQARAEELLDEAITKLVAEFGITRERAAEALH